KGWSDEDAGRKVEVWLELISLIAGGRGCSDTEVANYENVGHDCGNRAKALDSTEKTIEGTREKKLLIGIWTEKTGFSLEKLKQIMYFLTLNCWLRCGTILSDVVVWVVPYGRRL
ncbi:hypothetical protein AVEN_63289-1, partial [Araneus ventricosus]